MLNLYSFNFRGDFKFSDIEKFQNIISKERLQKVNRFLKKEDALRSFFSELLLRYILIKYYKIKNEDIEFYKNDYGKPYLKNIKDLYFNLSHSGDFIICGISKNELGVDVEEIKKIDYDLTKYVFSKEEEFHFKTLNEEEKEKYFFKIWSAKESYIKAEGKGLSINLNKITIKNNKIETLDKNLKLDYEIQELELNKNYSCSVCGDFAKTQIINVNKMDIFDFLT